MVVQVVGLRGRPDAQADARTGERRLGNGRRQYGDRRKTSNDQMQPMMVRYTLRSELVGNLSVGPAKQYSSNSQATRQANTRRRLGLDRYPLPTVASIPPWYFVHTVGARVPASPEGAL